MEARPWKRSTKELKSKSTLSSSSSSYAIANLPDPILMEILCRMSVKTLTISRCVCKSWLNLIKDPHFFQMHQKRSPTEVCFQRYNDVIGNALELHLGNFNFPNSLDPCHFEIPKFSVGPCNGPIDKATKGKFIFANSCNGLLCYYGDPDYRFAVVWNPCTSECITFPPARYCRGYGLGFSRKENKFKLLRLMNESRLVVADICTIEKSCSWKRVGPCSSHAWFRDYSNKVRDLHAVFLQGTLHWAGTDSHKSCIVIHTFDFEDDRFGTLALPPCFNETYKGTLREDRLGVMAGCLFVTDYTSGGATIWLMREYGVQDSWTKLFSLRSTIDKGLKIKCSRCLPVTYMDNGEILVKCTSKMTSTVIVYNPAQKSARVIGSGLISLRVIAYRPSLVMLKDSMLGYDVFVKPIRSDLKQREISRTPNWWTPTEDQLMPVKNSAQQHGSKAPLTNDELSGAEVEEERERHISEEGLIQISASTDEIHVPAKREDRLGRIKNMMGEVLKELRKEREQRQELEEGLRNELDPLKEQTEHLKLQNQQLQERQQDEHAKVERLEDRIENLCNKQEHKQKIMQMMDEMKVLLMGLH